MQLLKILTKSPYIILLLLTASISISTLNSDFLNIDDITLIVNNPQLDLSWTNLSLVFTRPMGQIFDADYYPMIKFLYYRPALSLLYTFNNLVWGINPVGFHITNLILHLLTTIFVYRIGLLLFEHNKEISLLAAALFCVHPVHNELIGRVAMNENLLGVFMATSFYFYLQNRKYLSLIAFALALLSKESAVMLPLAILFFELRKQNVKNVATYLLPYSIVMAVYFAVRTAIVGFPNVVSLNARSIESLLTICSSLAEYLRLLFVPYPLSIYYPVWKYGSSFELLLPIAICLLLGYTLWRWQNEALLSPLLLGTVVLLAPVVLNANSLILGLDRAFIAERQLYVPALFFSLLIGALLMKLADSRFGKYAAAAIMFVLPFSVFTNIATTAIWANNEKLEARFIRDHTDSTFSKMNRGAVLLQKGDLDGALAVYKATLPQVKTSTPGNISVKKYDNLAAMINQCALEAYQPWYANSHFNIGQVYLAKNDIDTAMRKFKTVLVLRPHSVEARTSLADIYMKKGMFPDASREYKLALKEIDALKRP